jgi:hypothetical protein
MDLTPIYAKVEKSTKSRFPGSHVRFFIKETGKVEIVLTRFEPTRVASVLAKTTVLDAMSDADMTSFLTREFGE